MVLVPISLSEKHQCPLREIGSSKLLHLLVTGSDCVRWPDRADLEVLVLVLGAVLHHSLRLDAVEALGQEGAISPFAIFSTFERSSSGRQSAIIIVNVV